VEVGGIEPPSEERTLEPGYVRSRSIGFRLPGLRSTGFPVGYSGE